jgi:protein TonB
MRTRDPDFSNKQHGSTTQTALAVVVIFALLGVAAWFLIIKPNRLAVAQINGTPAAAQAPGDAPVRAGTPANVDSLSVEQLLTEARSAMNEKRLVAPAGNNAYELYLKALERQPGNPVAADALRETFTFASSSAEQAINQRDFGEAQREIDLLAKADPENYTLTILRSKLDAQRKTLDREQQQQVDQQRQQTLAAQQKETAAKQAQEAAAEAQRQQALAAAQPKAPARTAATVAATPSAAAPRPAVTASDEVKITDAVQTRKVNPRYPTAAQRANQEGWVDVEFTVDGQGKVSDVKVVDAQPKHVFDRAAIDAVDRWEFTAATRNGEAMPVTMRRRLEFKLGR